MHLSLMSYKFTSKVGTFCIRPQRNNRQRAELWFNDECISSYDSAELAATDVATRLTGYDDWDLSSERAPEDLSGWKKA